MLLFAAAATAAIRLSGDWLTGIMAGFDIAAAAFLLSCLPLLAVRDSQAMRRDAQANDANRAMLLAITVIVMLVILATVAAEILGGGDASPRVKALVIATLLLAWLFGNTIYALHYAHLAYRRQLGESGVGLLFPETPLPVYADFVYFAFTLGMTFQTSDVAITDGGIRRTVTFHCLLAFVFNIGVLAFTINLLGG